jgi:RNA-directed DNA polymerase
VSDLKQKPFDIPKRLVWEAYRKVAANKGAAGVDGQSIAEFEEDLKGNLYKLWNRLSSGAYFPPPVRGVEIPKKAGGIRLLGVPRVPEYCRATHGDAGPSLGNPVSSTTSASTG